MRKWNNSFGESNQVSKNNDLNPLAIQVSPAAVSPNSGGIDGLLLEELQSRIQSIFESVAKDADVGQILKDIKRVLEDAHGTSVQDSADVIPLDVQPYDIHVIKRIILKVLVQSQKKNSVHHKNLLNIYR